MMGISFWELNEAVRSVLARVGDGGEEDDLFKCVRTVLLPAQVRILYGETNRATAQRLQLSNSAQNSHRVLTGLTAVLLTKSWVDKSPCLVALTDMSGTGLGFEAGPGPTDFRVREIWMTDGKIQ